MIVVSDTSPNNYFTLIGSGAPAEVRRFLGARPGWLRVMEIEEREVSGLARLDRGERDVILLGLEMQAQFVLIDEARGREAAITCGLSVAGTIGVLEHAVRKGLINGPEAAAKLRSTNFRATSKLLTMLSGIAVDPGGPRE